jgi:catechol 2,3-dioxygenase
MSERWRPAFSDIAHVGHVEILTPSIEASLRFFTDLVGLFEVGREKNSVFLRAWGEYQLFSLQLTESNTTGLGHLAFRAKDKEILAVIAKNLENQGTDGRWMEAGFGHGPAFRFRSPGGHTIEIYSETERYSAPTQFTTGFRNQPQRRGIHGIGPRRLDHINLLCDDVRACRTFYQDFLGLRLTEQIVFDNGTEMGAWLTATNKSYDLALTSDQAAGRGRLHHVTYFVDSREEVLRAADILVEGGIQIETGPHKHNIGQTFFLYFFEPGGNRIELGSGGYLIFDPEWKPIRWTEADRAKGQAWGLKTIESFHTYGTPPIKADIGKPDI